MKLTHDMLMLAKVESGSWNRQQMELMGVKWPPTHGWTHRIIGNEITDEDWAKVLALSGVTKRKQRLEILARKQAQQQMIL